MNMRDDYNILRSRGVAIINIIILFHTLSHPYHYILASTIKVGYKVYRRGA